MLVVHGIWAYGALQVWAEDSALPARAATVTGRPSRASRPHPFAAPSHVIADALTDALAGGALDGSAAGGAADLLRKALDEELTLRLPSTQLGPLASPELFRPPAAESPAVQPPAAGSLAAGPVAGTPLASQSAAAESAGGELGVAVPEDVRAGRPRLAAWRVPSLSFGPAAAAALLRALAGMPQGTAPGTPAGTAPVTADPGSGVLAAGDVELAASVGYLAAVATFAADLAARGRMLPALVIEDDGYAARWRPVLSAPDARHARELAAAMPPACRAADGTASGPLFAELLDTLTDAAVRALLPGPLLPARRGRRPARIDLPERMLLALAAPDAAVELADGLDERDAAELSEAFADWLAAAALPAGSVRTCFRLVEPQAEPFSVPEPDVPVGSEPGAAEQGRPDGRTDAGDNWRVELSLQSADDPSLMLPAEEVWAGAGDGWLSASPAGAARHPEEELLAGLGAAARLFPALDGALREAAPAEVALDTAGALGFLRETGPLLSGAGFGVLLPDWARKARLGLRLTTRTSSAGTSASGRQSQFGMQDLVSFRYDLALGDDVLTREELAELARLKVPLVRVRGQWVELDDRHLKAALKFLERGETSGTMTAAEVLGTVLAPGPGGTGSPGGDGSPDLPLAGMDADGWLGDLLSGQADERLEPMETPDGFRGALRPYQRRGLSWLSFLGRLGIGAILADDMGLGKTVQLLALLCSGGTATRPPGCLPGQDGERDEGNQEAVRDSGLGSTLLICPMSLTGNWQREAERFAPGLAVHVHHGADRLTGPELAAALRAADLVITTYQTAARDLAALSEIRWARLVCDEAQAIKNHLSQQSKAVRSLPAASRIALTGTPVENQLSELWSIMEFANPGMLGSAKAFREQYAVPIERHGSQEAAEGLRRVTRPFVLRRLKTDKTIISDLPEKQEMRVWCNLTQEQASLYAATVSDMLLRIEGASDDITRRGLVLATMAKLKQVCNHPAHLLRDGSRLPGRSGKLARLEELCEEIAAEGDKALIFTQYAEFGRMLQPYLAARTGCPVLFLHGGTSRKQRDALVAQFQEADEPVLFLLSLKAGGTGLNLTAANHVIHVDRWWNPAVEEQATDRAFRIGQRRDVQVRKFVCVGTLEEKIDAMIEQKKALADQIVGTGESWLTELSTAALREVLTLAPEAVSA
jgi:superfamily II DNA or RNA helicase